MVLCSCGQIDGSTKIFDSSQPEGCLANHSAHTLRVKSTKWILFLSELFNFPAKHLKKIQLNLPASCIK